MRVVMAKVLADVTYGHAKLGQWHIYRSMDDVMGFWFSPK
jgi:hypothetical protein